MTDTDSLARRAHAFLFTEGGALPRTKLANLIGCAPAELPAVLDALTAKLEGSGLTLVATDSHVTLATAPSEAPAVRDVLAAALGKDIGDAGLEVLSIVLYRGPSTRAQIDYIRGVNTSSTTRALLSRGLLERADNPADARSEHLRATAELLAHLGVTRVEDLPDYATIARELAAFEEPKGPFGANHGTDTGHSQHEHRDTAGGAATGA